MKKLDKKNSLKQITCIIVVIMLCNFILPNYSFAVSTGDGGSLVNTIAQFVCFLPDTVIELLQKMFVSNNGIEMEDGSYKILYSPGTIFSGKVPAFDINYIDTSKANTNIIKDTEKTEEYIVLTDALAMNGAKQIWEESYTAAEGWDTSNNTSLELVKQGMGYNDEKQVNIDDIEGNKETEVKTYVDGLTLTQTETLKYAWYNEGNTKIYVIIEYRIVNITNDGRESNARGMIYGYEIESKEKLEEAIKMAGTESVIEVENSSKIYESTTVILQNVISTWYNALRRIALVGLLSVLVYIGIRIVLTSTSAKEKAKYKKMLKDWLVALCLLFTLHYIMSITVTVVGKINEVVEASAISSEGEDILMTSVRECIAQGESWSTVLPYVAIYCVLVVYTVIFTIQYLRRAIYLAFLTMIAPLITVTYPLDKIKDSKAQAFDKWLKDYIFFTLLQVVHLLIYYVLLESSLNLENQGNWLYAIVAIGFMTKAENIIKNMFGFEKSKSLGALTAGATGAIVMNAINKISHKPPKGGKPGGAYSKKTENTSVRTVTVNPINIPNVGDINPQIGIKTNTLPQVSSIATHKTSQTSSNGTGNTGSLSNGKFKVADKAKEIWNRPQIKGTRYVIGKFVKNNYKQIAGKTLGVGTGLAGGMIGLASGVAEGDVGKSFTRMAAGVTAGTYLAQNVVDFTVNTVEKVPEKAHNVADTYREGAYGKEYADNVKANRKFRNSDSYKKLKEKYGKDSEKFEKNISQMLEAEITDTDKMEKILKRNSEHPRKYDIEKAISYSKMADKCSDEVLYNSSKFIRFCEKYSKDISDKDLENLRKCIVDFK